MIYQSIFGLEADVRVKAVLDMEKHAGITRRNTTFDVTMTPEDEKAKPRVCKTLEETLHDRAEKIGIQHSVLAKIDACWRLSIEWEKANKALHEHEEDTETLPATFPLFRDLQARANKYKSQKDETDVVKLKDLRASALVETSYIDEKVQDLNKSKAKYPAEIKKLKEENGKLDQDLKKLMSSDDDAQVTIVMGMRRRNRARLSELEAELISIEVIMGQYEKDAADLAKKIVDYTSKIEGTPLKKQKIK